MVVEVDGGDGGFGLDDEVDGVGFGFCCADGFAEGVAGEDGAVDGDDLLSGSEGGLVGGAVPADVGDGAFAGDADADGVPDVDAAAWAAGRGQELVGGGGLVGVDELVAALLDAGDVGVGVDVVDAVVEEGGPVVFDYLVEVVDELFAVVGDDERAGVAAFAEEDVEEVGEGFFVVGELADEGVGVEPEEFALLVVVLAALPVGPGGVAAAEDAGGDGGVFGAAPFAAGCVVEQCGGDGDAVEILRLRFEAGAGGEDVAEVLGQAFVDPEERALLHLLEVGLVEVVGAAVLAVPGVGELVGEEVGCGELVGVVGEVFFIRSVVGGLAVLEAFAGGMVGEREEEVVDVVVARVVGGSGFADEVVELGEE